jgi:hypothetical protein
MTVASASAHCQLTEDGLRSLAFPARAGTIPANGRILGNTAFQINFTDDQIIYNPLVDVTSGNGVFNGFVFRCLGRTRDIGLNPRLREPSPRRPWASPMTRFR